MAQLLREQNLVSPEFFLDNRMVRHKYAHVRICVYVDIGGDRYDNH